MALIERSTRRVGMFSKIEAVYGTAETTFAATDAGLFVEPPTILIETDNVERKLATPWHGNSDSIPTVSRGKLNFKVELAGSGAAGTPPIWGKYLLGCGMAETISAGNRVEYTFLNDNYPGLTHRFFADGIRYLARGSRGNAKLDMPAFGIATGEFDYQGFDTQRLANAIPAIDLSGFLFPEALTDANAGALRLGSTLTAGVISGGTILNSMGISIDFGNELMHKKILNGGERIHLSKRSVTAKIRVELDAATEVQWAIDIKAGTVSTLSFNYGSAAGKKVAVHFPRAQREMMQRVDEDGNMMFDVDIKALPTLAGLPELIVISS